MEQVTNEKNEKEWWLQRAQVQERAFTSNVPIVGRPIAWLRTLWHRFATKLFVRPLLYQQTEFNRLLVDRLHNLDTRLIAQDRELAALVRDAAEISTQLVQTNRQLQDVVKRLSRIEADLAGASRDANIHDG